MPWIAGIPRDAVDWGPTIDPEKCVSCGMCMNCGKKVFDWVDGKPVVARYNQCVVGCSTCGNLCEAHAITFPSLENVRETYRKRAVWGKVKKALIQEGKIPPRKARKGAASAAS